MLTVFQDSNLRKSVLSFSLICSVSALQTFVRNADVVKTFTTAIQDGKRQPSVAINSVFRFWQLTIHPNWTILNLTQDKKSICEKIAI